jgi:hypothetical protein
MVEYCSNTQRLKTRLAAGGTTVLSSPEELMFSLTTMTALLA